VDPYETPTEPAPQRPANVIGLTGRTIFLQHVATMSRFRTPEGAEEVYLSERLNGEDPPLRLSGAQAEQFVQSMTEMGIPLHAVPHDG
jgi:hypothetical protein